PTSPALLALGVVIYVLKSQKSHVVYCVGEFHRIYEYLGSFARNCSEKCNGRIICERFESTRRGGAARPKHVARRWDHRLGKRNKTVSCMAYDLYVKDPPSPLYA
ncbi:unnamed protein product, partial [Scytosiphon promiscuus]